MRLGIFSDVHDHLDNLKRMMDLFAESGIVTLLFCGDFCSPIPSRLLGGFPGTVHCVFGNGDGDRFTIQEVAHTASTNLVLHGEWAELELDGAVVAMTHYPFYARALARTGDYRTVFSGHAHERHEERIGACLWVNPGEILGWKGTATCAIYDTDAHQARFMEIG